MGALASIQQIRTLMRRDMDAHIGDIAVLKCDLAGLDARPELRPQLAAVRDWLPDLTLAQLLAMPSGSFGHAYGRFLAEHGLAPFRLTDAVPHEVRLRNTYGIRYATTHDMFHVLLGFGPDWVGEIGVLGFTVGQGYNRTLWIQGIAAWITYPFLSGFRIAALLRAWQRGIALGRRAPFMLGERLEDQLEDPLSTVRARYGLA